MHALLFAQETYNLYNEATCEIDEEDLDGAYIHHEDKEYAPRTEVNMENVEVIDGIPQLKFTWPYTFRDSHGAMDIFDENLLLFYDEIESQDVYLEDVQKAIDNPLKGGAFLSRFLRHDDGGLHETSIQIIDTISENREEAVYFSYIVSREIEMLSNLVPFDVERTGSNDTIAPTVHILIADSGINPELFASRDGKKAGGCLSTLLDDTGRVKTFLMTIDRRYVSSSKPVITHELGHLIDSLTGWELSDSNSDLFIKKQKTDPEFNTTYAETSEREYFAELTALAVPDKARRLVMADGRSTISVGDETKTEMLLRLLFGEEIHTKVDKDMRNERRIFFAEMIRDHFPVMSDLILETCE